MAQDAVQLSREIIARCRDLGFAAAGICRAEPTAWRRDLEEWLAAGHHGSMGYLAEHVDVRLDLDRFLPGVRALILVADLYAARGANVDPPLPPGHGRIARYARGRDYHEVIKKRLHGLADALRASFAADVTPGAVGEASSALPRAVSSTEVSANEPQAAPQFRAFVDTAPVLEREHAARAGLGWVAKHTLVIHPRLGSYTLLGGIATTLELAPPPEQEAVADHCGTCTRCIDACPTRAISPYSVDATRCISYLTIEQRGPVDPVFHTAMGEWLYGCDICQEVCPHNSPRPDGAVVGEVNPAYASARASFDLLEVLNWTEDDRRRAFTSSAMKRATLAMMKRNAIIAAGNAISRADHPGLRERLRQVSEDASEPELVRLTARQVLARLGAG